MERNGCPKKLFERTICGKVSFTTKQSINGNVVAVHEEIKPFKCEICDYSCSIKSNMNKHVARVHEEKEPF